MVITLKDGSFKEYSDAKTVLEIASDLSEGLARVACAGEIDGQRVDLRTVVDKDCKLNILTFDDKGGRDAFRHTASHIMAQAIKRLYPEAKLAIGPSVDDGFYYDIDCEDAISQICVILGDIDGAIEAQKQMLSIMKEDWTTEGESVDSILREIKRLEGLENQ